MLNTFHKVLQRTSLTVVRLKIIQVYSQVKRKKYQIDRLQKVLNAAARLIFRIPKFDHISPALFHLHWLPVAYRVHFKPLLLVFKSLNNQGPQYIREYLQPYSVSGHHLRSCDQGLLRIPRTFGDRAFPRSGPFLWNKNCRVIFETARV